MVPNPRSGAFPSSRRLALAVLVVLTGAGTAACEQGAGQSTAPPSTTVSFVESLPDDPAATERRAVENAYVRFWSVSWTIDQLPQERWRPTLEPVASEPLLTRLVEATRIQQEHGIKLYGDVYARVADVQVHGDRAEVRDCQDASKSGQADATTGKPRTVGVARNPIKGTLLRDGAGAWLVVSIEYPGGTC